jgi:type II secretory pathway pseudopilin PulG
MFRWLVLVGLTAAAVLLVLAAFTAKTRSSAAWAVLGLALAVGQLVANFSVVPDALRVEVIGTCAVVACGALLTLYRP